jgi:hypothetical protein
VNVEITMPYYGGDAPGEHVATAPVAPDGSFSVTAPLPADACRIAANFPGGRAMFFTYNADEPRGMAIFASAAYTATVPAGDRSLPNTGAGPASPRPNLPWRLAAGGVASSWGALACAGGAARRGADGVRS